jgi:dihydrolipoamide dehydrogenase
VIVATGSVARDLPFAKFDGDKSHGRARGDEHQVDAQVLVVIGAGAIGMEFAYFYKTFGTDVTVVEMLPRILPVEDDEVSTALEKLFVKHGMKIKTSTTTTSVEKTASGVKVTVAPWVVGPDGKGKADESKKEVLEADKGNL